MSERVIVSRHLAAIEFIARENGWVLPIDVGNNWQDAAGGGRLPKYLIEDRDEGTLVPVLISATPRDVAHADVFGNLPLNLAAAADSVYAIEFSGPPPRGQEYTLSDMEAAGATLRRYQVTAL